MAFQIDREVSVRRLLQLCDDPEDVVHLVLPLLRFEAAGVRMGHVDVHEVSQVEAEVRDATDNRKFRHFLTSKTLKQSSRFGSNLKLQETLTEIDLIGQL